MLPHNKFIEMVRYKAEEYGIQVIVREESYTSKASAMDFDEIPDFDPKERKPTISFSGKRLKRGLYQSSKRHLINADINGSANIGEKNSGMSGSKSCSNSMGASLWTRPQLYETCMNVSVFVSC